MQSRTQEATATPLPRAAIHTSMKEKEKPWHFDTGVFVPHVPGKIRTEGPRTQSQCAGHGTSSAFTGPLQASSPAPSPLQRLLLADDLSREQGRTGDCRALTSSKNRKAVAKACGTWRCCKHPCPGVTRQRPQQHGQWLLVQGQASRRQGRFKNPKKA